MGGGRQTQDNKDGGKKKLSVSIVMKVHMILMLAVGIGFLVFSCCLYRGVFLVILILTSFVLQFYHFFSIIFDFNGNTVCFCQVTMFDHYCDNVMIMNTLEARI